MVIWVYAGGGEAELGFIPWLQKHFPGAYFQRRMPQRLTHGPRPGFKRANGRTGKSLEDNITEDLNKYWRKNIADVILLLDDTDCEPPRKRNKSLREAIPDIIYENDHPCLVIALAVPELEVWLLADWENTFEKKFHNFHKRMQIELIKAGVDFDHLQEFDCHCHTPEYRKISETIREAFEASNALMRRYSKASDTSRLLQEANPNNIADKLTVRPF